MAHPLVVLDEVVVVELDVPPIVPEVVWLPVVPEAVAEAVVPLPEVVAAAVVPPDVVAPALVVVAAVPVTLGQFAGMHCNSCVLPMPLLLKVGMHSEVAGQSCPWLQSVAQAV